jgi:hypothetical protein
VFWIIFAVGIDEVSPADTNNTTLKDACTDRNVKQSYYILPENFNAINTQQKKKKMPTSFGST